ncbi:ABC transporter permease [Brevibacterium sp.]|uniref:ABC transporter permease n=1 Tax=Brevibacterium sp. TaxID=1701 RepID=UPI00281225F3|nr:ABC transporter permease [Brevibacterium sp.]
MSATELDRAPSAPDRILAEVTTPGRDQGTRRSRILSVLLPPVLVFAGLIALWQVFVLLIDPRPDLYPGPAEAVAAFVSAWEAGTITEAVTTSLQRGVLGFGLSVLIAVPIGLVLAETPWLRRAFGPFVTGLQVLPSVAWVPVAIIWFGLTDATVFTVILLGAVPSIINGLVTGMSQVPPQFNQVARVLGASRRERLQLIVIPAALPNFIGGLKQGWAFAWRSLMAAEIIATGGTLGFGLGALLDQGRQLADMAGVFTAIVLILVVGVLIEIAVFGPLERFVAVRRGLR